jgi:hypothetical protein
MYEKQMVVINFTFDRSDKFEIPCLHRPLRNVVECSFFYLSCNFLQRFNEYHVKIKMFIEFLSMEGFLMGSCEMFFVAAVDFV